MQITAQGTVEDFDEAGFQTNLGAYLGVPPADIRLKVSAASVSVEATITFADASAASSVVVEEMSLDDYEAARAEAKPAGALPKKRMSVDAKDLSIPVLQGKLRLALGQSAKLPKKKPELLALYMRHCDE